MDGVTGRTSRLVSNHRFRNERVAKILFKLFCTYRQLFSKRALFICWRVERDKPDTYGARKVMITYESISAVKLTSPLELPNFQVMGFQGPF